MMNKEPAEDDSSSDWLALEQMRKCYLLEQLLAEGCDPNLVALTLADIAERQERLRWLFVHGSATEKGLDRAAIEELAREKAAKVKGSKARYARKHAIEVLRGAVPPERLAELSDSALAKRLARLLIGERSERTLRGDISAARKDGRLPPRARKLASSV
jgi:hypothetical protein